MSETLSDAHHDWVNQFCGIDPRNYQPETPGTDIGNSEGSTDLAAPSGHSGQAEAPVAPPASGVSGGKNPYAGTASESIWQQGFDAGFAQPDEAHPAPSPYAEESRTVYAEGVLAGQDAARPQPQPNQSMAPPATASATPATAPVDNSTSGRFMRVIEIAATEKLGGAIGEKLKELLSPANLAIMMAFVGVYVAAQATPAGWVADGIAVVTLVASAALVGKELSGVIDEIRAFIKLTQNPNGDLDAAAQHLANAAAAVGVDVLLAIILHKAGGAAKPYIKPPQGMVEMVTPEGLIIQVPAEAVSAAPATLGRPVVPPTPLQMSGDPSEGGGEGETGKSTQPTAEAAGPGATADALRAKYKDALTPSQNADHLMVEDAKLKLDALAKAEAEFRAADTRDPSIMEKHKAFEEAEANATHALEDLQKDFKVRSGVQPGASAYNDGRIYYDSGKGLKTISAWESPDGALKAIQAQEGMRSTPELANRIDLGGWWNGAFEHYLVTPKGGGAAMGYDVIRSRIGGKDLWSWIRTTHTSR